MSLNLHSYFNKVSPSFNSSNSEYLKKEDAALFKVPLEVIENRAFYSKIARKCIEMTSRRDEYFINQILSRCKYEKFHLYYLLRPSRGVVPNHDYQICYLSFSHSKDNFNHIRLAYNTKTKEWRAITAKKSFPTTITLNGLIDKLLNKYKCCNERPDILQDKEKFETTVINTIVPDVKFATTSVIKELVPYIKEIATFRSTHQLALEGDAEALEELAQCYYVGHGCIRDEKKALKLLKMVANLYNASSILHLGLYYEKRGTIKDLNIAFSHYLRLENTEYINGKIIELSKRLESNSYAEVPSKVGLFEEPRYEVAAVLFNLPIEVVKHPAFYFKWARSCSALTPQVAEKLTNKGLFHARFEKSITYYLLRPSHGEVPNPDYQVVYLSFLDGCSFKHIRLTYNRNTKEWAAITAIGFIPSKTLDELINKVLKSSLIMPVGQAYKGREGVEETVIDDRYKNEMLRLGQQLGPYCNDLEEFKSTHQLALKGSSDALEKLAGFYKEGRGCEKDEKKALKLRKMAAERGNTTSILNLCLYYEKRGKIKDLSIALSYYLLLGENNLYAQVKIKEISNKFLSLEKPV